MARAEKLLGKPKNVSTQAARTFERLRRPKPARAKKINWQDIVHGTLTLSREELRIYPKRRFWRVGKQEPVLVVPTPVMTSFELVDGGTLVLSGIDQNETEFQQHITFADTNRAQEIAGTLDTLFEDLGIYREQAEKAERQRREREEQQRKAEQAAVESERQLVWTTTAQLWGIISELRQIIMLLRSERWDTIEASWRRITSMGGNGVLNMAGTLTSMVPAIESKAADTVYDNALAIVQSLADAMEAARAGRAEGEELAVRYESRPRWSHLPYFLVFSLLYTDTILSQNAGNTRTATDNMSRLQTMADVLNQAFELDLRNQIAVLGAALQIGDPDQIAKATQDLESRVSNIIENNSKD